MGNRRFDRQNDYILDEDYADVDFDERKYMQSALFDIDDNSDYYDYSYDKNSYITEGNDYFDDSYNYVDNEYSYVDADGYNGYYDDYYDNSYNSYADVDESDSYYHGYNSDVRNNSNRINYNATNGYNRYNDDQSYIEVAYKRESINQPDMDDSSVTMLSNRNVDYAVDRNDAINDERYGNVGSNVPALKYNNIPTNNIQFEDSFVVNSSMFEDEEEKIFTLRDLINLSVCIVLAFVLAYLIAMYGMQHTSMEGVSMDYNIKSNDVLLIDKFTYKFSKPNRYDVIVYDYNNKTCIKRVIGLPGESIRVEKDGKVFVNGEVLESDKFSFSISSTNGCEDVVLKDNEYFVLGDNRNGSEDSRGKLGPVNVKNIVGKAVFRIYPFNAFGTIDDDINAKIKAGDTKLADDNEYKPDEIKRIEEKVSSKSLNTENTDNTDNAVNE